MSYDPIVVRHKEILDVHASKSLTGLMPNTPSGEAFYVSIAVMSE